MAQISAELRSAIELQRAGRLADAEAQCRRALSAAPDDVLALQMLGVLCGRRGDWAESVRLLRRAVELRPDDPALCNDLGVTLEAAGEFANAACSYREAVRLRPGFHPVWSNLGNALLRAGDVTGATAAVRESIRISPCYAPARNTLASILMEQNRVEEACAAFREAIAIQPDFAQVHANLGLALLAQGKFEEGWREHEWRRRMPSLQPRPDGPEWTGGDPFGQTILLVCEGGLGNAIQFARFVPVLAKMGARVVLECHPRLKKLLGRIEGVWQVIGQGEPPPHYHMRCPLMSVPALIGTTLLTIPPAPYLPDNPADVQRSGECLHDIKGFRVGVCWQGDQQMPHRRNRSFPPEHLMLLADVPGVKLINLQIGADAPKNLPLSNLPALDAAGAFLDTAAIMRHLDLAITCDTSIAHLAGAIGVKCWVALPFAADWRWMLDREDSPWYPTLRLFRQEKRGDWAGVFHRTATELRALAVT